MWIVTIGSVKDVWDETAHISPLSPTVSLSLPYHTQASVAFLFYRNKNNVTGLGLLFREKVDSRKWFRRRGY